MKRKKEEANRKIQEIKDKDNKTEPNEVNPEGENTPADENEDDDGTVSEPFVPDGPDP